MSRLFVSKTPLPSPASLKSILPPVKSPHLHRQQLTEILSSRSNRVVLIAGPCSIHDPESALEYAKRLKGLSREVEDQFQVLMRVHGEKPRTTVGWKGLTLDPHLDGSDDIAYGIEAVRELLIEITALGVPCSTEFLDPLLAPYFSDLITWGQIGARTSNSQVHRQLASSLPFPVGFKNPIDGNIQLAVQGALSAQHPHSWIGQDEEGKVHAMRSSGNPYAHIVLRGGREGPNYQEPHLQSARLLLKKAGLPEAIFIDCSHDNCRGDFQKQTEVFSSAIASGVEGVLLESYLEEGKQGDPLLLTEVNPHVSVTDPCLSWDATEQLVLEAHRELEETKGRFVCILSG